jgi:hypothetical protein
MVRLVNPKDGLEYAWVKYGKIIEDLPILNIGNSRSIARRFEAYCQKGIMEKEVVKNQKGSFATFRLNGELIKELKSKPVAKRPVLVKGTSEQLEAWQTEYLLPNEKVDVAGQRELEFALDSEVPWEIHEDAPEYRAVTGAGGAPHRTQKCDAMTQSAPDANVPCEVPQGTQKSPAHGIFTSHQKTLLPRDSIPAAAEGTMLTQNEAAAGNFGITDTRGKPPGTDDEQIAPDAKVPCETDVNVTTCQYTAASLSDVFRSVNKALVFDTAFYKKAAAFMNDHHVGEEYIRFVYDYMNKMQKNIRSPRGFFYRVFLQTDIYALYHSLAPQGPPQKQKQVVPCPACGVDFDVLGGETLCMYCFLKVSDFTSPTMVEKHHRIAALSPDVKQRFQGEIAEIVRRGMNHFQPGKVKKEIEEAEQKYLGG